MMRGMPSASAASRTTSAAVVATGVSAVAGSPGQPVPGGTGERKSPPVTGCWAGSGIGAVLMDPRYGVSDCFRTNDPR